MPDDSLILNQDVSMLRPPQDSRTAADKSAQAATGHTRGMQAIFIDLSTPETKFRPVTVARTSFGAITYLEPPEDPERMWQLYQLSAYLGPVIDEVVGNVYQTGFEFQPVHEFGSEELNFQVKCALAFEQGENSSIGETEIERRIEELKRRAEYEYGMLDAFYRVCASGDGYAAMAHLTGQDLEISGNAYWEVLRNQQGQVHRFRRGLSKSIRAMDDDVIMPVLQPISHPIFGVKMAVQFRDLRRYVQIHNGQVVGFFKEFGDPRVISRATGDIYETLDDLERAETDKFRSRSIKPMAATEIFHMRVPFAGSSVYGKPTFSGAYPGLSGARDLDEFNKRLVVDEEVPSLLLAIAGPRIGEDEVEAFRKQVEEKRKRRGGILFLNAYDSGGMPSIGVNPTAVLKTEKLKSQQTDDALFQKYEAAVEGKADTSYRLPSILRGKGIDAKKVIAAERFAEGHVFGPRREVFAQQTSDRIMPALGVYCWRVVQKSNPPRDPEALAGVLAKLAAYGFVTPNEGRRIIEPALPTKLPKLAGPWAALPQKLLTALLQTKNKELASVLVGGDYDTLKELAAGISEVMGLSTHLEDSSKARGNTGGSEADIGGRFGEEGHGGNNDSGEGG